MPYTTATLSSAKKFYKGGYSDYGAPGQQRRPANNNYLQYNKNFLAPNVKSGKAQSQSQYRSRPKDYYHYNPRHDVPLHRSLSPPSGTLLERIGGLGRDEVAELTPRSDRIDEECSWGVDFDSDSELRFSTPPHFYTPEPREVEEFLDSVIDALSASPSPSGTGHACSGKPALTLETRNFPVDRSTENTSSSVLYSPTQATMNSLTSPTSLMVHHHHQSPQLGDTVAAVAVVPPASASIIEECRKHLLPVLAASTQTRDSGRHLGSEQYLQLLSDDHCQNFFRQAKEMRHQLSSLVSQGTPVLDGNGDSLNGCLKRSRVDEVDAWIRNTRGRFDSDANMSIASDAATVVSRTDSDITFVDSAGGATNRKWPPSLSPRSQAILPQNNWLPHNTEHGAPTGQVLPLVASPVSTITQDHHPTPGAFELFHQSLNMYPALAAATTSQPKTESDTLDVSVGQSAPVLTGPSEQSLGHSDQPVEVAATTTSPSSAVTDFVSHRPTEPGIWFRQRGTQYKEIVDVDIEMSDEVFYVTRDHQPFRLRKHLRLCSFPVDNGAPNGNGSEATTTETATPETSLQEIVGCHASLQWPRKGKLVLQVNPESERSKTWLPHSLESDPIDVTSCMRPGKNTFRFIQLSDLSSFSFVLVASAPPREEEWRSWDWESFVEGRGVGHSSVGEDNIVDNDEDKNGLSEFARIPVTVRS